MPVWTKTCPKCGMSWQSEHDHGRICPFCHCDLITGKMPGENGYNGNWNYDQPNNNNQPNYDTTPSAPMTADDWAGFWVLAVIINFVLSFGFIFASLFYSLDWFFEFWEFEGEPILLAIGLAFFVLSYISWMILKKRADADEIEEEFVALLAASYWCFRQIKKLRK